MTKMLRSLPAPAPMAMPIQQFEEETPRPAGFFAPIEGMFRRRVALVVLTLLIALVATSEFTRSLLSDGIDIADPILLALFFPLFGWIAFGFVAAAIGYVQLASGRHPGFIRAPRSRKPPVGRTAVLVPIYNEDVDAVLGRVRAMATGIERAGGATCFDFFVLSDSAREAEGAERKAWAELAADVPVPVYYRRRPRNIGRKPGNIAEWVRRFGGAYDYMLVLDADSLMSADVMMSMAQTLDRNSGIGLLQTIPTIIGAATVFQRWMQFSSWLYGPLTSAGLVWWSGSESTFWGHNALLRTRAFAESCGLPELTGKAPFGGHILSHDMVEAALLRRRGWAAHMLMIEGSHEECPPTVVDMAVRDRRWAQGNLQHLRIIRASGFHWVSRFQLLIGASGYGTSPGWLLLILVTLLHAIFKGNGGGEIAPPASVLMLTIALLFGPKLLAVASVLNDREQVRAVGGEEALLRSVMLEVPLSMLLAPVTMLTQTIDLLGIFLGRSSGWNAQNRDRDGISLAEALRRYKWHMMLGLLFVAVAPLAPVAAAWLAPVTIGLLSAPWLVSITASRRLGARMAAAGVFCVAEPRLFPHGEPGPTGWHPAIASADFSRMAVGGLP